MKTRAEAALRTGTPRAVTGRELDAPAANEVPARSEAAGLRRSGEPIRARGRARRPAAGGHDGAASSRRPAGTRDTTPWRRQAPGFGVARAFGGPAKAGEALTGILSGYHRKMRGALSGGANPLCGIPVSRSLRPEGHVKPAKLITRKYSLEEINAGCRDLMDGKNIRGVIVRRH